jgi:hypothetical protein
VRIQGADLNVIDLEAVLWTAAEIPVSHSGVGDQMHVLAHVQAETADEARRLVMDALPDGDYTGHVVEVD